MFSKYYQSELTYLREIGREFAQANPSLASVFSERGADPDVERLFEGFAFLTARIRERIDDAVPEIIEALSTLLLPHYLRALPASSVVELSPHATALRGRHKVPAGTELGARPIEGTTCLFRTTGDLDLLPLTLTGASVDFGVESRPSLTLTFRTTESGKLVVFQPEGFRLFLHGQLAQASAIFAWFQKHLAKVEYRAGGSVVALAPSTVSASAMDPAQAMLPWPRFSPDGLRVLQEYFTLPARMLFVDVLGLEKAAGAAAETFEIVFHFDRPPKLPERLDRELFRLHCVPVVNLFEASSDPIPRDLRTHEYLLRAGGVNPKHMEVYSVDRVVGLKAARKGRREYKPFYDFAHAALPKEEQAFYATRRVLSPIDRGIDTYLAVMTPRDVEPDLDEEVLSIDLTCTNRSLPNELRVGDISMPTPRSPTIAKFRNITPVTKPVRPPIGSELHWRLIGHLALNMRSLSEPGVLRSILALYNFYEEADQQLGRANELRIEGVRDVSMRLARRLVDNVPMRGVATTIELEEANYAGPGDAILFGSVLDRFFADRVTINSFHQLTIKLHPSGAQWTWPPTNGTDPMM